MTLPSLIANQLVAADKIRIHSGMGSHELTALLTPTPSTLDTRGNNYTLPDFPPVIADQLKGKKVLIISADGPELPELIVPMIYLAERGAEVVLAGQDWIFQYREPAGHIVVAQWLAPAYCIRADIGLSEVQVDAFDMIFIAGGAWNPDMLRTDMVALGIVRKAYTLGIPVASICHGPQVLISAAFDAPPGQVNFPAQGVRITGTASILRDLRNAGFEVYSDQPVVYDGHAKLLTARDPRDLRALCQAMGALLLVLGE